MSPEFCVCHKYISTLWGHRDIHDNAIDLNIQGVPKAEMAVGKTGWPNPVVGCPGITRNAILDGKILLLLPCMSEGASACSFKSNHGG